MIEILDWIGRITTVILLITIILAVYGWFKGILPALLRLGNGFSKRKIAIFAKGDNLHSLKSLLLDSKLFNKKNIIDISSQSDFGRADQATLYLVFWHDWKDNIDEILNSKKDGTALVVYAPQDLGFIPAEKMKDLNSKRNVVVTNFRGRLLNDIVVCLMTTSYE
ncbi:MAG TPA: hypothetical protein VNW29_00420 [Candidatus Sulfotelmatobacter sp.]|jgi:hypothetical protein|nr:hypothetical protein [Candidatus Sulfotelmatobacter sp.]